MGEMSVDTEQRFVAFRGEHRVGAGTLEEVVAAAWRSAAGDPNVPILCFDAESSIPIELDLRGELGEVLSRARSRIGSRDPSKEATAEAGSVVGPRGPGRPRLGVVAREVTLLPRHWEWLNAQPGGASVALRKLVEAARRDEGDEGRRRRGHEATYRFMLAVGGNLPDFEEATRALFAGDQGRFELLIAEWPTDVRAHVAALARSTFSSSVEDFGRDRQT